MDPKDNQLADSRSNHNHEFPLPDKNPAADLLRQKISSIYEHEPSAKKEIAEVSTLEGHAKLSKHQKFMLALNQSGKSQEQIQTDWHDYYQLLSDTEKHEVWREFHHNQYVNKNGAQRQQTASHEASQPITGANTRRYHAKKSRIKTPAEIKNTIRSSVSSGSQLGPKQHLQSLFFGIGVGAIVLLVLLFGFFNERFIAPFITPNKTVTSTPIISDSTAAVGKDPKIIIPKINVEIPVVYNLASVDEKTVQNGLEKGVVHYASTALPGQKGNTVVVGHSSNNIFNSGQYKFAFVLLSRMEQGDTFMMEKDGVRYTYRVYEKKIVSPNDLSVLGATDRPATVTLITCDPPGTSINRLIVVGEQINPDPNTNKAAPVTQTALSTPKIIPGNAPSLWSRLTSWF
jgi:sortase A